LKPATSPPSRPAKQYALWLLGRREWSAKELRARLKLKGYSQEDIDTCIEFCQAHRLQSDQRFAESRTRLRANSHGNQRILQELSQKGIADADAKAALADAGDEVERARNAAKRFVGKELTIQLQAKAWRFLGARGFSGAAIKVVLQELKEGAGAQGGDFECEVIRD
jgi:regulatory protein